MTEKMNAQNDYEQDPTFEVSAKRLIEPEIMLQDSKKPSNTPMKTRSRNSQFLQTRKPATDKDSFMFIVQNKKRKI